MDTLVLVLLVTGILFMLYGAYLILTEKPTPETEEERDRRAKDSLLVSGTSMTSSSSSLGPDVFMTAVLAAELNNNADDWQGQGGGFSGGGASDSFDDSSSSDSSSDSTSDSGSSDSGSSH